MYIVNLTFFTVLTRTHVDGNRVVGVADHLHGHAGGPDLHDPRTFRVAQAAHFGEVQEILNQVTVVAWHVDALGVVVYVIDDLGATAVALFHLLFGEPAAVQLEMFVDRHSGSAKAALWLRESGRCQCN